MSIISFGEYNEGNKFKILDERVMRGSAGLMLLLAIIAFINGFIVKNYIVLPFISGFLVLNFSIGIFINPKFSPTVFIAKFFVRKQSALPIGAIQKKFAWSMGLMLSIAIFSISLLLLKDVSYFEPVCMLCIICLLFLYLETAFGVCMGCKIYQFSIKMKIIPTPKERPNCMGDSCSID